MVVSNAPFRTSHDHKYEQIDFSLQKINSWNVSFIMMLSRLVSSYSLAAVSTLAASVCEHIQVESSNKCEQINKYEV